jgi:hypothetical protein
VTPAAPAPAETAAPPAAGTATPEATATPTADPSDALLDYLFGKDGGG